MTPLDRRQRGRLACGSALFVAAALGSVIDAHAAACGKRAEVVEALRQRHGERPAQIAMADDGRVLELWTRPDGRWTLLATSPKGYACIQATGQSDWESLPQGEPA